MQAKDITAEKFLAACKSVVDRARSGGWRYGNSTTTPPCADKIISCDRLIARALWDLGFTDQRKGGETCGSLDAYLTKHGFEREMSFGAIRPGSIILVKHAGKNYWSHAFVMVSFNPKNFVTSRYDTGSNERIRSVQPLTNMSWGYRKDTVLVFNIPQRITKDDADVGHRLIQHGQRMLRLFMGTGGEPKADGIYDGEWKVLYRKGIQKALNQDHNCGLKVDGQFGEKTMDALRKYTCEHGTFSYMNSMLEIGFYLNNMDPKGYEQPGHYGDGLVKCVERLMGTSGDKAPGGVFMKLIK